MTMAPGVVVDVESWVMVGVSSCTVVVTGPKTGEVAARNQVDAVAVIVA
jgi:hypothetical protein